MCADYQRQVSYGASIVAANLLYTAATLWDKNATQLGAADWAAVAANTGYAWGYAGLWLVDGQLGSPDPGCGLQVAQLAHSTLLGPAAGWISAGAVRRHGRDPAAHAALRLR